MRLRILLPVLVLLVAAGCGDDDNKRTSNATPSSTIAATTATPTETAQPSASPTRVPPTATAPVPATATSTFPATATATSTQLVTETATPEPTTTDTSAPTLTPTPTETSPPPPNATATASPEPTATPTTPPDAAPADLSAAIDGSVVNLSWTNPPPATGYTVLRVLRRLNAPVDGPADAQAAAIFAGTAAATTDAVEDLLPDVANAPRTYHYAVYACTEAGACETEGSATTLAPTLVQVLRVGGYVIHWRHSSADVCVDDVSLGTASSTEVPNWWRSCEANCEIATARQLNQTGVDESIAIGQAFDDHGIPVGRVLSSEYCRCFSTAERMDFGPPIELEQGLTLFVYSDVMDRCEETKAFIHEVPAPGTNTAMIGHTGFTCRIDESEKDSNLGNLEWAEAAIFKLDAAGGVEYVTRLMGDEWAGLPD